VVAGLLGVQLEAAEMGRHPVQNVVPETKGYSLGLEGTTLEVGLNWDSMNWKIGETKFSDQSWGPQASLAYGVSDNFDIRATTTYLGGQEDKTVTSPGGDLTLTGDLNAYRLGVGSKGCVRLGNDFGLFGTALLNYYVLDVKEGSSTEGMFGIGLEGGAMYLINDWVTIQAMLHWEHSLGNGSTEWKNSTLGSSGDESLLGSQDISMDAWGLGLGVGVKF